MYAPLTGLKPTARIHTARPFTKTGDGLPGTTVASPCWAALSAEK